MYKTVERKKTMDRKKTIVHFLTAIAFVIFAIQMFQIASGTATTDRFPNPDGSYDYSSVLALYAPFLLCIVALAGLIVALQDGEWGAWLGSLGAIAIIALGGYFLDMMNVAAVLIGGVYTIWWAIVAFKTLAYHWDSFYWENKVLAVVRLLIAVALASFVLVWLTLPLEFDIVQDMSQTIPFCACGGALAIAAAVGLAIEGILWIRCDS